MRYLPLLAVLFLPLACTPPGQSGMNALFDGESLKGWEGNPAYFRVEDGAIVAGDAGEAIPRNEFLCTEQRYGDFELRLEAKLTGEGKNAGVQFRSERIPGDHEVIGYQYDIGHSEQGVIWASLYDESRRRTFLLHPEEAAIDRLHRPGGWNELVIRCEGPQVRFWFNGEAVLDYTEAADSLPRSGIICLQIHSGPPAEAAYRNIRIQPL